MRKYCFRVRGETRGGQRTRRTPLETEGPKLVPTEVREPELGGPCAGDRSGVGCIWRGDGEGGAKDKDAQGMGQEYQAHCSQEGRMQDACQERRKEVQKRKEKGADRQEGEQMVAVIKWILVSPGCLRQQRQARISSGRGKSRSRGLEEAPHRPVR